MIKGWQREVGGHESRHAVIMIKGWQRAGVGVNLGSCND